MAAASEIVRQAYVTVVTSDSYAIGALVLAHSLRKLHTDKHLVCLISENITADKRNTLVDVFDHVVSVQELHSNDAKNLQLLNRPELGVTFTKIHVFNLTQYQKCVYLDADTLAINNVDDLFERDVPFAAAPDVGWPDCFNSGVFFFKPSAETFKELSEFAVRVGSFDGGDQGLLNSYFATWSSGDASARLPFTYNMTANASYGYVPAYEKFKEKVKIIHFIGAHKPWHGMPHPGPGMSIVASHFEQWWRIHDDFVSCCSSSCSYKTLVGQRPTRSPHPEAEMNPPPMREGNPERMPADVRRPRVTTDYLASSSFSDIQAAIDDHVEGRSPPAPGPTGSEAPAAQDSAAARGGPAVLAPAPSASVGLDGKPKVSDV